MTSPEWEAANEDDSDRFPQETVRETIERLGLGRKRAHLTVSVNLDPVPGWGNTVEDYRALTQRLLDDAIGHYEPVVAVADEERAALVVEVERLRRGGKTLGEIIDKQCQMVLDATGLHDWVDDDGDGDWGAIWDHLFELRSRAETAEAEVERLRETSEHRVELLKDAPRERDQWHDAAYNWAYFNQRRAEAAEAKVAKVEADVCRFAKDAADVQTKWLAAEAHAEAVEAALRRVRELHQRRGEDLPIEEDWCEADGRQWPCPTSAALSDPTPTVKDQS